MVKAVIFDLDDTLVSEKKYIESGFCHVARILSKKLGITAERIFNELMDLSNENSKKVFNRFLFRHKINYTEDIIMHLVEEYQNHLPKIEFYDDVLPCLEYLRRKGCKTGIITDGYANSQRQKLIAVKAYDYFDEIIITDELGRKFWKPHPKAFEIMRSKLGIKFNEMVYVGDNPEKDFYISNMFPIKTIRICREGMFQDKEYLNGIRETYLIYSLIEIKSIIK